ncbi:MAG: OmpA family protein [Gammaproteobacteria bacterium]
MAHNQWLVSFGLLGVVMAGAVRAEGEFLDNRFYLVPFGTFVVPDGARDVSEGWGGGLAVGKIINRYLNLELKGLYNNFQSDGPGGSGDVDEYGGGLDALVFPWRSQLSPYGVVSLMGLNTESDRRGSELHFTGEAGAGLQYELDDHGTSLRTDVRYRYNADSETAPANQLHEMVVNLGIYVPLGPKPQPVAEAPAPVDDCSTRDSDGDGVDDCLDKCPGTLKGAKVDDTGCLIRIELHGVNFEYDSAELTATAKSILDGVADQLVVYPEKKDIEVQGHASSEGSSEYNLALSDRRSQSVVDYLKERGVTNNLYAKGYGEEYPIADNSTEEGREKNRRVELVWMGE